MKDMILRVKDEAPSFATKDFALHVKDVSDEGTFTGYGSIFGNVDSYGDKVAPGAFAESLARHRREGTKPLMLWQHRTSEPIGVWEDLVEDGKGLKGTGRFVMETSRGKEAHALLKAGAIRGLSIGYREIESEPEANTNITLLKKLDLVEISVVSFPANRRARVESVKSERMEELARRFRDGDPMPIKDFEDLLREAGFPKSAATAIASRGYAAVIRSESEGEKAKKMAVLHEAVRAFLPNKD